MSKKTMRLQTILSIATILCSQGVTLIANAQNTLPPGNLDLLQRSTQDALRLEKSRRESTRATPQKKDGEGDEVLDYGLEPKTQTSCPSGAATQKNDVQDAGGYEYELETEVEPIPSKSC